MNARYSLILILFFCGLIQLHAENTSAKDAGSVLALTNPITYKQFHLIDIAVGEARRQGIAPDGYVMQVSESDTAYSVVFDDPNRPKGGIAPVGNSSNLTCFSVIIDKRDMHVVKTVFCR